MKVKLKHEFEMILLEILERRGGCVGIPKLVILLVLVHYFFLIISCYSYQTKKYFHLHVGYKMVSSPNKWYNSFNQDANSSDYWKPFYSRRKYITNKALFFYFVFKWESFNDLDFAMVPLAWTTHAQGRPQLLHCSSFSFTFHILFKRY